VQAPAGLGTDMIRSTLVVDGPLALRMQRLAAAREGAIGREIMTLPLMAARLAGGFAAAAGSDVLYPAIQAALAGGGFRALGAVSPLPGMPRAVLRMLEAAWRADINLLSLPATLTASTTCSRSRGRSAGPNRKPPATRLRYHEAYLGGTNWYARDA